MNIVDLTGVLDARDLPCCPVCDQPIDNNDLFVICHAEDIYFLAHYECADVEFFNA